MDSALLLQTLARQRLLNALALGLPPQALAGGFVPVLASTPALIPIALSPVEAAPAIAASSGEVSSPGASAEWTPKEDASLRALVAELGTSKWSRVAARMGTKTNRQCRRRWQAILTSMGNKGSWTAEEDAKLLEGHRRFGNRWTDIARLVPGRTDNAVKNRFAALAAKGEGVKSAKVARWSDVCAASPSSAPASSSDNSSLSSSLKRKSSLGSDSLDSADFAPSLKRLRAGVDLDLNTEPESAVSGWLAEASEHQESSEASCVDDAADSPRSSGFLLDLNFPAIA